MPTCAKCGIESELLDRNKKWCPVCITEHDKAKLQVEILERIRERKVSKKKVADSKARKHERNYRDSQRRAQKKEDLAAKKERQVETGRKLAQSNAVARDEKARQELARREMARRHLLPFIMRNEPT